MQGAKLLYLESPNSWVMGEQNLLAIGELAKRYGVVTMIDNSWASPIFQKPLAVGIDLVIHSASKYISGPPYQPVFRRQTVGQRSLAAVARPAYFAVAYAPAS
jgi:hypothetical protein